MKLFQKYFFNEPGVRLSIRLLLRRTLVRSIILFNKLKPLRLEGTNLHKVLLLFFCVVVPSCLNILHAQRTDISLNKDWYTRATDILQNGYDAFEITAFDSTDKWKNVDVPHNW